MAVKGQTEIPVTPVGQPIICKPYDEPKDHWVYDRETGEASRAGMRRPASYWYRTERTGSSQRELFAEEERDDLPLVNRLRDDVRRWREAGYRGATTVSQELLRHWSRTDRPRRLFFCQREAVETIIYLAELRLPGKSSRTRFQSFEVSDEDIRRLCAGERPGFDAGTADFFPTLVDRPAGDGWAHALRRLCAKMATGSGKTVVMSMLIAWAFCNRGVNPQSREFPNAVLICCPNLTVKERLQVLRPEHPENYYAAFDIVPLKYRPLLQAGEVLITNWHVFAPESEHKEGDRTYAVVNKGPETPDIFAKRLLGDLAERMPIMVLNDEGHHCWRPAEDPAAALLTGEARKEFEEEAQEARVWLDGLDRLNNAMPGEGPGIALCVDLSATPFFIKGSGHPEGRPFPWIVSDFGLVDAIESGIVKIPRMPVQDTTGRPDPRYFKLWEAIRSGLEPAEFLPGRAKKPKPEVVYREAEGALKQIAGQWVERYGYIQGAAPGQERVPPVLIIVCDNTDIAEVFYRRISGETEIEAATEEEVRDVLDDEEEEEQPAPRGRSKKPKKITVYGTGVGRGLRRMDYIPDPATGLLTEEYVDVYGIPFSVIPFKGRPVTQKEPEDKPKNHVRALPERAGMEMRFPVVEGYAFALTKNRIRCDIERMERLRIEPNREPTGTFVSPTVGYRVGSTADSQAPFGFATQDRSTYYAQVHLQTILFQITQRIVDELTVGATLAGSDKRRRVLALQARHQLFPKVLAIAERYADRKVDFQGVPKAELGLKKYVDQVVERIRDAIVPDDSEGEPPLLPLLNRYKEIGTTAEVDFKTTRPCFATQHSHINQVVADTQRWEQSAAFQLEQAAQAGIVRFYAKNDSLGLVIPYEYLDVDHGYEPDYLVRLDTGDSDDLTLILEVKGDEDNKTLAKHAAARRWVEAATNWRKLGRWMFHVCRNPQTLKQELQYLLRHLPKAA